MLSCDPSLCCQGYVLDSRCPLHLGAGLGPKIFTELYPLWVSCAEKETFGPAQWTLLTKLASVLHSPLVEGAEAVREQILSGRVSHVIQKFVQTKPNCSHFYILHQAAISKSGQESADVAVVTFCTGEDKVQSLLEVKLVYSDSKFPEIQATAYSEIDGRKSGEDWMPVFSLSRNHYSIGVAFRGPVGAQWCYSQIYSTILLGAFDPADRMHMLALARFLDFFAEASALHESRQITAEKGDFVLYDKNATPIPLEPPLFVIGDRVLLDSSAGPRKVAKFYADRAEADAAVAKNMKLTQCLGYENSVQQVFEGFGPNATCIVTDTHFEDCGEVSYLHLVELTNQISLLYANELVHGDIRIPNVLFLEEGKVRIVDSDWLGGRRESDFPENVNPLAFGARAQAGLSYTTIPSNFDWLCLADILDTFGCAEEAVAAAQGNKNRVVSLLGRKLSDQTNLRSSIGRSNVSPAFLNLFSLGGRLGMYYKNAGQNSTKRQSAERKRKSDEGSQ